MGACDLWAAGFLLFVNVVLLLLGLFLLEGSTILWSSCHLHSDRESAGHDLVHFVVIVIVNIMIGLLRAYRLLLFVLANMTKRPLTADLSARRRRPLAAIVVLTLVTAVPGVSVLWLPRQLGYKG